MSSPFRIFSAVFASNEIMYSSSKGRNLAPAYLRYLKLGGQGLERWSRRDGVGKVWDVLSDDGG